MLRLQDWADLRRALYATTGIDFGLCRNTDELAAQVRKHAQLIADLVDLPQDQVFTISPEPNWAFPTPVEGRTQKRKTRLPGDGMRVRIRGCYLEVRRLDESEKILIARPEQEGGISFFQRWQNDVKQEGLTWQKYSGEVDTGTRLLILVGVWPWSIRNDLIAFR